MFVEISDSVRFKSQGTSWIFFFFLFHQSVNKFRGGIMCCCRVLWSTWHKLGVSGKKKLQLRKILMIDVGGSSSP